MHLDIFINVEKNLNETEFAGVFQNELFLFRKKEDLD